MRGKLLLHVLRQQIRFKIHRRAVRELTERRYTQRMGNQGHAKSIGLHVD